MENGIKGKFSALVAKLAPTPVHTTAPTPVHTTAPTPVHTTAPTSAHMAAPTHAHTESSTHAHTAVPTVEQLHLSVQQLHNENVSLKHQVVEHHS